MIQVKAANPDSKPQQPDRHMQGHGGLARTAFFIPNHHNMHIPRHTRPRLLPAAILAPPERP